MKTVFVIVFFMGFLLIPSFLLAAAEIEVVPSVVMQGEPIKISVVNLQNGISIKSATIKTSIKTSIKNRPLSFFIYEGTPTALAGIDLYDKPGIYEIRVNLSDGNSIVSKVEVVERKKIEMPLGIPLKLGGNTPESQNKLVSSLSNENAILNNVRSGNKSFWTNKFSNPIAELFITDGYGYSRKTGEYSIAHKGVDFRAKEGTPVMAMNRGVIRLARTFRVYGKTVVVDHGLGLQTLYIHLSKIKVNEGELVLPGQLVGLSGKTGYAEYPHLHLSVKIKGISVDPMKFLALMGS